MHPRIHSFDMKIEFSVNLLDAINFIHAAWSQIIPSHISNCFRHAGFRKMNSNQLPELSFSFNELDILWDKMVERGLLTEEISLGDYMSFDDNLVTRSSETIHTIFFSSCNEVSIVSDDDDDEKVNNEADPKDPPNGRECLEMIEKIVTIFNAIPLKVYFARVRFIAISSV